MYVQKYVLFINKKIDLIIYELQIFIFTKFRQHQDFVQKY